MSIVSLRQLLDHAAEYNYGIPAFNVNNMEQVLAIMEAAKKTDSPVILQASRGARQYAGDAMLKHVILGAVEMYPNVPVCMHQDHGNSVKTCLTAMCNNYSSVMMDGSLKEDGKTPAEYDYNVQITREVVHLAHRLGVSVEGELGCLGSLETGQGDHEDGHGFEGALSRDKLLTDPDQAVDFVRDTQVDALAVAIGTSHGAYKFTSKPNEDVLAMDVLKMLHKRLPTTHFVMHGSSSVPQDLQDIINSYGGEMPQTFGVPVDEILQGIRYGVRKINIDTDCRLAITGQIRKFLTSNPLEFDPRKYFIPAFNAMRDVCIERYEAFGSAGHGSKIQPLMLSIMSERYETGELQVRT